MIPSSTPTYNQSDSKLVYVSAGHPPAILLSPNQGKDNQVQSLKTPGLPVGMFPEAEYVSYQCQIVANSTLYVFSDGAYEICQSDGSIWSLDAFTNLLASQPLAVSVLEPPNHTNNLDLVLQHIKNLSAKEALNDDLSLLQINFV